MISILLSFFLIAIFLYIIYFGFLQNYVEKYIDVASSSPASGDRQNMEGLTNMDQQTMVYYPYPKSGISREVKIGEWIKESQMIMGFLKVDNRLMKEASTDRNAFEQYRVEPTSLEGYKITSSYETNDEVLTKKYGEFFTGSSWPNKLAKPVEFEEFKRKWIDVCRPVSKIYSKIHHHFRIKDEVRSKDAKFNESYFANVFFEWMDACAESSQDRLEKAKKTFYDIVRFQEVQTDLVTQFSNNVKYANQDEALYILNMTEDFLSKIDTGKFENKAGQLDANGIQSNIHVNYIAVYQISSLLFGVAEWMRNIERNTKIIKTKPENFYAGFEKYVAMTQPNLSKKDLFSYYLLENMPVA
jgi:hypothetical protein